MALDKLLLQAHLNNLLHLKLIPQLAREFVRSQLLAHSTPSTWHQQLAFWLNMPKQFQLTMLAAEFFQMLMAQLCKMVAKF
jgi:hypothetical protein